MRARARPPTAARRSNCPINVFLEVMGDSWSLLIVRDLLFTGPRSFQDFTAAPEGIATNVLADRLARLESAGMVEKCRDRQDARRFVYRLSSKGFALAPILLEIILWAGTYEKTAAPPMMLAGLRQDRSVALADLAKRWAETAQQP